MKLSSCKRRWPLWSRSPAPAARPAELGDFDLMACTFRTGNLELFVVNPVTGAARNLTQNPATDKYPSCSFDGKQIAFVSDREGSDSLFVMNADGSNVRRLARVSVASQGWPVGRPMGSGLFRPVRRWPAANVPHPSGRHGVQGRGEGTDPAVSPDGKRLAFDGHGLFVMNSDGTNRRRLGEDSGYGGLHATWTPDGKTIIYADRVGTALELFSCDPDSGKKKELTRLGGRPLRHRSRPMGSGSLSGCAMRSTGSMARERNERIRRDARTSGRFGSWRPTAPIRTSSSLCTTRRRSTAVGRRS